ncbi:MAG: PPOX class F420-dependent oxidoreductase [Nitrososphaerales archaeon]|nr:PPOX class F420-dependent oxidoreductase [Nitrososphaerales archaeon]
MKFDKKAGDFLKGTHFAKLATPNKNGSPQLTPVRYKYDNGKLIINTTRDRQKFLNMKRDDRVAFFIDEGYRYVATRGRAREAKERDPNEDIEALAVAYTGEEKGRESARDVYWKQQRVSFEIAPLRVFSGL